MLPRIVGRIAAKVATCRPNDLGDVLCGVGAVSNDDRKRGVWASVSDAVEGKLCAAAAARASSSDNCGSPLTPAAAAAALRYFATVRHRAQHTAAEAALASAVLAPNDDLNTAVSAQDAASVALYVAIHRLDVFGGRPATTVVSACTARLVGDIGRGDRGWLRTKPRVGDTPTPADGALMGDVAYHLAGCGAGEHAAAVIEAVARQGRILDLTAWAYAQFVTVLGQQRRWGTLKVFAAQLDAEATRHLFGSTTVVSLVTSFRNLANSGNEGPGRRALLVVARLALADRALPHPHQMSSVLLQYALSPVPQVGARSLDVDATTNEKVARKRRAARTYEALWMRYCTQLVHHYEEFFAEEVAEGAKVAWSLATLLTKGDERVEFGTAIPAMPALTRGCHVHTPEDGGPPPHATATTAATTEWAGIDEMLWYAVEYEARWYGDVLHPGGGALATATLGALRSTGGGAERTLPSAPAPAGVRLRDISFEAVRDRAGTAAVHVRDTTPAGNVAPAPAAVDSHSGARTARGPPGDVASDIDDDIDFSMPTVHPTAKGRRHGLHDERADGVMHRHESPSAIPTGVSTGTEWASNGDGRHDHAGIAGGVDAAPSGGRGGGSSAGGFPRVASEGDRGALADTGGDDSDACASRGRRSVRSPPPPPTAGARAAAGRGAAAAAAADLEADIAEECERRGGIVDEDTMAFFDTALGLLDEHGGAVPGGADAPALAPARTYGVSDGSGSEPPGTTAAVAAATHLPALMRYTTRRCVQLALEGVGHEQRPWGDGEVRRLTFAATAVALPEAARVLQEVVRRMDAVQKQPHEGVAGSGPTHPAASMASTGGRSAPIQITPDTASRVAWAAAVADLRAARAATEQHRHPFHSDGSTSSLVAFADAWRRLCGSGVRGGDGQTTAPVLTSKVRFVGLRWLYAVAWWAAGREALRRERDPLDVVTRGHTQLLGPVKQKDQLPQGPVGTTPTADEAAATSPPPPPAALPDTLAAVVAELATLWAGGVVNYGSDTQVLIRLLPRAAPANLLTRIPGIQAVVERHVRQVAKSTTTAEAVDMVHCLRVVGSGYGQAYTACLQQVAGKVKVTAGTKAKAEQETGAVDRPTRAQWVYLREACGWLAAAEPGGLADRLLEEIHGGLATGGGPGSTGPGWGHADGDADAPEADVEEAKAALEELAGHFRRRVVRPGGGVP